MKRVLTVDHEKLWHYCSQSLSPRMQPKWCEKWSTMGLNKTLKGLRKQQKPTPLSLNIFNGSVSQNVIRHDEASNESHASQVTFLRSLDSNFQPGFMIATNLKPSSSSTSWKVKLQWGGLAGLLRRLLKPRPCSVAVLAKASLLRVVFILRSDGHVFHFDHLIYRDVRISTNFFLLFDFYLIF